MFSGETIHMPSNMNLIFEVQDLQMASPAVVSRCGVLYTEPLVQGWTPLWQSWLSRLVQKIGDKLTTRVQELANWFIEPCLAFMIGMHSCTEHRSINLIETLTKLFDSMLRSIENASSEAQESLLPSIDPLKDSTVQMDGNFPPGLLSIKVFLD